MNWFIISFIPPIVWAISNHIDKFILSKYFKGKSAGPFILVTSIYLVFAAGLISIFFSNRLNLNFGNILVLISLGVIGMLGGIAYVNALNEDNPSTVIPLFQIIPIFNYILGLIFLNERLTSSQIIGSILIMSGAILITLEQEGKRFRIKNKVIFLMLGACLTNSIFDLLFKKVTVTENYWGATFWAYIGMILFGAVIILFHKSWRDQLFELFSTARAKVIGLNFLGETLGITGALIFNYALLIMPIALVSVVGNGLQPFFVLLFGIILTLLFPHLAHETLSKRHLGQKILAILIIFLGTYLLNK